MLTFIIKLSFNLTVLKNPPCNIIVTYLLHPCHFPTSTTAQIQCTITCSRQNTWPAEKQKEYNMLCCLKFVLHEESIGQALKVERANKRNKENRVKRLLTSERNRKIIMLDEVSHRIAKGLISIVSSSFLGMALCMQCHS
jgi:hypothetical protein